jgi:hypothetical protein
MTWHKSIDQKPGHTEDHKIVATQDPTDQKGQWKVDTWPRLCMGAGFPLAGIAWRRKKNDGMQVGSCEAVMHASGVHWMVFFFSHAWTEPEREFLLFCYLRTSSPSTGPRQRMEAWTRAAPAGRTHRWPRLAVAVRRD